MYRISGTYISMQAFWNPELDLLAIVNFYRMQINAMEMATIH